MLLTACLGLQALSGSSNIIPSVVGFTTKPWTPVVSIHTIMAFVTHTYVRSIGCTVHGGDAVLLLVVPHEI